MAGLSVATLLGATACGLLLGLPDATLDPVEAICKCESDRALFIDASGESLACHDTIQGALEGAEDNGAAWVRAFGESQCDICENIGACLSVAPVCRKLGAPCSGGQNATCCGNDATDPGKIYCPSSADDPAIGTCVAREPGCLQTGAYCETDAECCGVDLGGGCYRVESDMGVSPGVCLSGCDPENPASANCEGCCARIEFLEAKPAQGICLAVNANGFSVCEQLSCTQEGGCPTGTLCYPHPQGTGFLFLCDEPPEMPPDASG